MTNTPNAENPFRRRNVSIPIVLYAKLAAQAKNKNRTISEYVRQLIQTGLNKEGDITEEIRKLAYRFFVDRNYLHGYDFNDWLKAERIIKKG